MRYVAFFEFDTQHLSGGAFFKFNLVETARQGKSEIKHGLECGCWGSSSRSYSHVQGVAGSVPTRNVSLRLVVVASSWNRFFLVFTFKLCTFSYNSLLGKDVYEQLFEIMVGKQEKKSISCLHNVSAKKVSKTSLALITSLTLCLRCGKKVYNILL